MGPEPREGWGGVRGGGSRHLCCQRGANSVPTAPQMEMASPARAHVLADPPNARANESLSCDGHGDVRSAHGGARIEALFTWLFESSWRSSCPAAAALAVAESFAAVEAEYGHISRLESRPRPRFLWKDTGFECWQPRRAANVRCHWPPPGRALAASKQGGRGTTYLFEEVLEAQRQQQRVLVLVQRLPERTCAGTCVASWLQQRK